MENYLARKIALVTGGTRGIGAAIAKRLKADGYDVGVTYAGNEKVAQEFEAATGILTFKWDVSNFDECEKGLELVKKRLGSSVDVLVNNAGITKDGMLHKMTFQQWQKVMQVDLDSAFNMSRLVIEGMREKGSGRIVNISSINGLKGQVGQSNYAAAKAGLIGFTKSLALEVARKGITVNAVAPGYIGTEMVAAMREDILEMIVGQIPVGRLGEPDEVANCVSFLVGPQSSFMTGETLSINGGQYMS